MPLQENVFYEFASFRLEPSERLLLRAGDPVVLPPKAFETLLLLVRNSGHVLSKDEIMKTVWADTFVEENNLTQQIWLLRRALGQAPNGNGYIETVPKLGYRFVVPVREVSGADGSEVALRRRTRTHIVVREQQVEENSEADTSEQPVPQSKAVPRPGKIALLSKWLAVVAVLAVAAAITYFAASRSGRRFPQADQPRTLAILPFRDLKADAESQFLGYSLADAIIARLGYLPELLVRPSSYVAKYRGGVADPRVVAQELHVQAVLTGNYLREGDHLRVSVELVDVEKAVVLWRDTLDLSYGQLLTVQDRVADQVARGLLLRVLPGDAERLKRSVPKDAQAYECFLRAQSGIFPNNYLFAVHWLEKSVSLDPDYAPAWRALGIAYAGYADWEGGGAEFAQKSRAAFARAIQLDPEIPQVRVIMAIQSMEGGELDEGVSALRQELRLNPNDALAHWWLTEAYLYGGMLEESIAEGERALVLDPLVNTGSTLNSYLHAGDYEKFLATMPAGESARTSFYRGLCYFYKKDLSRAANEFEHAYAMDPSLLHAKFGRAFLCAIRQQFTEGLRYLKELERTAPTRDGEMLYKMAQAYAALGDAPSALRLMQEAIDHSFYCHACFMRDPLLVSLHGEGRYAELLNLARERHERFRRQYF